MGKINSQLGVNVIITDKLIESEKKEQMLDIVRRQIIDSIVRKIIIGGEQVINVSQESHRDVSLRGFELLTTVDTIEDHTYASILSKMQYEQDALVGAMEKVNKVPWWKLLWWKSQGRKIVESKYA
jgi:hypothetical protein